MVHGSFKSIFRLAKCSQIYWHLTIQCGWTPKPPTVAYLSVLKLWTHDLYFSSTSISPTSSFWIHALSILNLRWDWFDEERKIFISPKVQEWKKIWLSRYPHQGAVHCRWQSSPSQWAPVMHPCKLRVSWRCTDASVPKSYVPNMSMNMLINKSGKIR